MKCPECGYGNDDDDVHHYCDKCCHWRWLVYDLSKLITKAMRSTNPGFGDKREDTWCVARILAEMVPKICGESPTAKQISRQLRKNPSVELLRRSAMFKNWMVQGHLADQALAAIERVSTQGDH